jgi:hypothetical protein
MGYVATILGQAKPLLDPSTEEQGDQQ